MEQVPAAKDAFGEPQPLRPVSRHELHRHRAMISTVYALPALERAMQAIRGSAVSQRGSLVDLGCSSGRLAIYIATQLGIAQVYGVDRDPERLAHAAEAGVRTLEADLETGLPLPIADHAAAVVTSFGALEHLRWYDGVLDEARRLLVPGGWFLLSMPNLGSYVNRLGLLLGYQPRDVEVSERSAPGLLPIYRKNRQRRHLGHVHSATLRCMRQLLQHAGFEVVQQHGYSPGGRRGLDVVFGHLPSLSRRFVLLARAGPR